MAKFKYEAEQTEHEFFTQPPKVDKAEAERITSVIDAQLGQGLPTETVEGQTEPEILVDPPKVDMKKILKDIEEGPKPYAGG